MRIKKGIVVSTKMKDTIVVKTDAYKQHSKYKKRYRVTNKFYAHDPGNKVQEGDKVTIYETSPISKLKRWTTIKPEEKAAPEVK